MPGSISINTSISCSIGSPIETKNAKEGLPEEELRSIEEIEVAARHILQNRVTGENDALYDLLETNERELSQRLDDYISLNTLFSEYSNQKKEVKRLKESLKKKNAQLAASQSAFAQIKEENTDYFDVFSKTHERLDYRYFNRGYRPVLCPYYIKSEHTLNEAIASGEKIDYKISEDYQGRGYIARIRTSYPNDKKRVTRAYLEGRKIVWEKIGGPQGAIKKRHHPPHPSLIKYKALEAQKIESVLKLINHVDNSNAAQTEFNNACQKLVQIKGNVLKRGIKMNNYNLFLAQEKVREATNKTVTALDLFIPQSQNEGY